MNNGMGTVGSNYEQIMAALNSMDEPRHEIYKATENIRQLAGFACTGDGGWVGKDAENYRGYLISNCKMIDSSAKWMNAICWQLKQRAEQLRASEVQYAQRAQQINNIN